VRRSESAQDLVDPKPVRIDESDRSRARADDDGEIGFGRHVLRASGHGEPLQHPPGRELDRGELVQRLGGDERERTCALRRRRCGRREDERGTEDG
jgi:hypothetical protein